LQLQQTEYQQLPSMQGCLDCNCQDDEYYQKADSKKPKKDASREYEYTTDDEDQYAEDDSTQDQPKGSKSKGGKEEDLVIVVDGGHKEGKGKSVKPEPDRAGDSEYDTFKEDEYKSAYKVREIRNGLGGRLSHNKHARIAVAMIVANAAWHALLLHCSFA